MTRPTKATDLTLATLDAPVPIATPRVVTVATSTSAAELQAMVNTAAAGTTLQLQAGHYAFDRTIVIDRDDISVIGAGSGKTIIDMPAKLGEEAFQIGSGRMSGYFTLAKDVAEGGKVITLTGAHTLVAGDYVYLSRDSTKAFYDEIGDDTWRNTDVDLRTSVARVAQVSGGQITLEGGVHFDFTTGETQLREIQMAERVSLGGFSVDYQLSTANPSAFDNTLSAYYRNAVIEIDGTADLRLFDVVAHDVPSLGVNVASSIAVQASGLTMTGAHNKGSGGNGYALQIRDVYDSQFSNLTDADMRHSVVFASWTSAVGNVVHVSQTDRDINFHGGRDHDNVVTVDRSVRDANSDIISPTVFVNTEGSHYGSVTDAGANQISFGWVEGTRMNDAVNGYDSGCMLDGKGGHDTLTGGAGNDLLIGGLGNDVLKGGRGVDIALYTGNFADFRITAGGAGAFQVRDGAGKQGTDQLSEVEWLLFDDGALRLADMALRPVSEGLAVFAAVGPVEPVEPVEPVTPVAPVTPVVPEVMLRGTSGKDVFEVTVAGTTVSGLENFDTVRSTVSFTLAEDVERLDLIGTAAIDGTGSSKSDHLHGNEAANVLRGLAGNDQLWGEAGNDLLLGGDGNDRLNGDQGDDTLDGGAGQDRLFGGAGADVFVFAEASDSARRKSDKILDFQSGVDRIDLTAIDADTDRAGHQAFVWGSSAEGGASLWQTGNYVFGDIDNDGIADMAIYINGRFEQADFLL